MLGDAFYMAAQGDHRAEGKRLLGDPLSQTVIMSTSVSIGQSVPVADLFSGSITTTLSD
jgi:hypothetical protein